MGGRQVLERAEAESGRAPPDGFRRQTAGTLKTHHSRVVVSVTVAERLASALEATIGLSDADALHIAQSVAAEFSGKEEVNDDALRPETRAVFYILQDHRLLRFRREEYRNEQGYERRAFWWSMSEGAAPTPANAPADPDDVYSALPAECWRREAGSAGA